MPGKSCTEPQLKTFYFRGTLKKQLIQETNLRQTNLPNLPKGFANSHNYGRVYELMIQGQSFRKLLYKSATAPSVKKCKSICRTLHLLFTLNIN